ncbi:isoprenylcysteine carboxylmethyltransferase family protein [Campylobacter sp. MIT 99-7217]|uniref:methyltransferase family protein n=1 Tax=Campylobacter sp. MIT 99-7217 TaxID=535091 RepID=UPI00163CB705|nr:isoprenylcysteine carboxylmethyltransferase family protein [Campylobacter sp. MIT 99-7217]
MKLNRFFWQYVLGALFAVWVLISYTPYVNLGANLIRTFGVLCVIVGVIGRIYATVFIGGMKNEGVNGTKFIDYGAYSLCRNPLYLFSFIALIGLLALKAQIVLILIGIVLYLWIYHYTILAEEKFLASKFGASYEQFLKNTSRFFPKFKGFFYPETIIVKPAFLHKELKRAVNWFIAVLVLLLIELLHAYEFLPNLYTLY